MRVRGANRSPATSVAAAWSPMLAPALVLLACAPRSQPVAPGGAWQSLPAPDLGPVVGRVGEIPIHAAEVRAEMARAGVSARQGFAALAELHLLAERARRAGRALPTAEIPRALMVQRLLERDFEPGTTIDRMPEADLRHAYQQVRGHYVHPRLVEVALLSVYTGPGMKPEPRARAEQTARALTEELERRPLRTAAEMAALAAAPQWKSRKVAFWKFRQGPDRASGPFGGKVAETIQRLRKPGDWSGLIKDESGFHFALYLGETPARNVGFAEARAELTTRAFPAWRRHRFEELLQSLSREHGVQVHRDRLLAPAAAPR